MIFEAPADICVPAARVGVLATRDELESATLLIEGAAPERRLSGLDDG